MEKLVRIGFGILFAGGALAHLILGQTNPQGYSAFGDTAIEPLAKIWRTLVMPHIRALTIVLAAIEAFIALGLLWLRGIRTAAVTTSLAFFACLLPLGFGWPTESPIEDFLKNRLGSLIMIGLMAPLLWRADDDRRR